MTKQEFTKTYLSPLEEAFGIRVLWNGKEARLAGRGARSGTLGVAYTKSGDRTITLLWQHDRQSTLQTLFHEVAHMLLHGKGGGCRKGKFYRECEAETVAKLVCEEIGAPYRGHFRGNPEVDYIGYYWKRYLLGCKRYHREPDKLRYDKIEKAAARIAGAILAKASPYHDREAEG